MPVVRSDPHLPGVERARWTLDSLLEHLPELRVQTAAGLWQVLERLDIHWKRGRSYIHSPDPLYQVKVDWIAELKQQVRRERNQQTWLYLDEFPFYRQPTLAFDYEVAGEGSPLARRSHGSDRATRVVATLDAFTGQVVSKLGRKIGVKELVQFYRQVVQAYPDAKRIWLVLDNWPVHFPADVWAALEPQECPFGFPNPCGWSLVPSATALKRWGNWLLPIQFVPFPTYAPWCNPMEKLWRKLNQEILHLHRLADDLPTLRERVSTFLQQFTLDLSAPAASIEARATLLRYLGLRICY